MLLKAVASNNNLLKYIGIYCSRTVTTATVTNSYIKMNHLEMFNSIKKCIPSLDIGKHKGQAGRIGIVGGSLEYTGAPYFAGISALRVGADLVHIFCPSSAANVIKSYSPELIVHPLLDRKEAVKEITPWFDRLHVIVIGPGLGREADTFNVVSELIAVIKEKKIPLVIDADGLFLVTEKPDLLQNFSSPVILTPNKIENERLIKSGGIPDNCESLKNIWVLKKGGADSLINCFTGSAWTLDCAVQNLGSGRRCGGQGDLLSGAIATFLNWTLADKEKILIDTDKAAAAVAISAYAGSVLVRLCNGKAFKLKGRSMLASDMIEHIHEAFEEIAGQ